MDGRTKINCFLILIFFNFQISKCEPIAVDIFYETYNEHVRKFITEQFAPFADRINYFGDNIKLNIYPYGRTTKINNVYKCKFGSEQCDANAIHACIINKSTKSEISSKNDYNVQDVSDFVRCFFKNRFSFDNNDKLTEDCLKNINGIKIEDIQTCMKDVTSITENLEKITNDVTNEIQESGLVIRINKNINSEAQTNFLVEVCNKSDDMLDACKDVSSLKKLELKIYYESNDIITGKYFNKQLFPFYHVLEDFVDIELIPYGNMKYDIDNLECQSQDQSVCMSNVFQALVINKYTSKDFDGSLISGTNRIINFVNCLFHQDTSSNVFLALEICSDQTLDVDQYETFLEMMKEKSDKVKEIVKDVKDKTEAAKISRIPYIVLNNDESISSFNDIIQGTCALYKGSSKPSICTKVKVDVLYAPLDHKTRTIFIEQLKPVFDNLQNLIEFNFVPAGKLKEIDGKFNCEPEQCDALRYHACIIDNYWNDGENYVDPIRQEVFDAIQCMFKNKKLDNVADNAEFCSELIDDDIWNSMKECFELNSDAILGENIDDTNAIINEAINGVDIEKLEFPFIIINEKNPIKASELKDSICGIYEIDSHKPDYCFIDTPNKIQLQLYYQSDSELSKYFFTTQYYPWYMFVEEMISIELIPGGDSGDNLDGSCDNNFEPNSTCFANKIQAFAIDQFSKNPNPTDWIDGTMRTMSFLRCVFSHHLWKQDYVQASESCADDYLGVDTGTDLITSAKADKTIYKKALEDTKEFLKTIEQDNFGLLPWAALKVNSDSDQIHSKRAVNDLLQTICNLYQGDKPIECTPVNVEVYYSGYHSQSRRFFVDELIPVYRNLRERIHLDLIPFGTLKNEDKQCSTAACKVNRLQACAIKKYFADDIQDKTIQWDGKNQTLSYIHCMFKNVKNDDIDQLSEECANGIIIQADAIHQCAQNEEGINALEEMKQKTANLFQEMEHAPWIIINGNRVEAAQSDLKKAICDAIIGDVPEYCGQDKAKKVNIQFHYSALDDGSSKKYVLEELYPNYRNLEEIMELDLVSLGQCEVLDIPGHPVVKCDNHDDEAHANLIHACVHDTFWNNDNNENEFDGKIEVVEFLKCYFENENYPNKVVEASEQCVVKIFGDIWSNIHNCAVSNKGFDILKKYQNEKIDNLLPPLKYIPWITVNDIHNYAIENHIRRTVCDAYEGREKPLNCYDPFESIEKPNVYIHYEIDDSKSVEFFTKYFNPENINELATINLVPFGRSTKNDNIFICKNDNECHKYREHACLIDLYFKTQPILTMKVIECTFKNINDDEIVNKCTNIIFEEEIYDIIIGCAKDFEKSDKLLTDAMNLANGLSKKISHSPWIVINQEHNIEAEINLADELCAIYYPADKPKECQVNLLPIDIYYQTRDDGSMKFFSEQLAQQVNYLNEIAIIDYVPYGHTKIDSNGNFVCSNDEQCHANMIHACVINYVENIKIDKDRNLIRLAEFTVCSFIQIVPGYSKRLKTRNILIEEKCAQNSFGNDIWRKIHECATGTTGKELMKKMKEKTDSANIGSILPEVVINQNIYSQTRDKFFQVLCNSYNVIRPPLCRTIADFAVPTGIYFTGDKTSQDYFNTQLKPLYNSITPEIFKYVDEDNDEQLYRLIAPDLIPWGTTEYDEKAADPKDRFICKGENECFINRFFACAISAHSKEPRAKIHLMEFAVCFFSNPDALTKPADVALTCTSNIWVPDPFVDLETCAKSVDEVDQKKLLLMRNMTVQYSFKSFPSITIDNIFNQNATDGKLFNVLCSEYQGLDIPKSCSKIPDDDNSSSSAVSIQFAYSFNIIILIVSLLILTQF